MTRTEDAEVRELPYGPCDIPTWTENYQFLGLGPNGVGLVAHFGTLPGSSELWHAVAGVSLPDGRVYAAKSVGPPPDARCGGSALLAARCYTAFDRWAVEGHLGWQVTSHRQLADGLLPDGRSVGGHLEVTFDAAGPVWDLAADADEDRHPEWGHFHYEQPLRMRGVFTVDGTDHHLEGFGYRDHSRGPRDMRDVSHSSWCNGTFPSGRWFGSLQVHRMNGDVGGMAVVGDPEGTIHDATILEMPRMDDERGNPRDVTAAFTADGTTHRITGRLGGGANFSIVGTAEFCLGTARDVPDAYLLQQNLFAWSWDGDTGYGLTDRCSRIDQLIRSSRS